MEEKKRYPKTPDVRIEKKIISTIEQIDRHKIPIYGGLFGVH